MTGERWIDVCWVLTAIVGVLAGIVWIPGMPAAVEHAAVALAIALFVVELVGYRLIEIRERAR